MKLTDQLNKTFMFLYSMEDTYTFPSAFEKSIAISNINPVMLLDTICDIGFADKEKNRQQSSGGTQDICNYWLTANGNIFIDNLPTEFAGRPYTYHLKLIEDDRKIKEERDGIDFKLKQVTLKNIDFNRYVTIGSLLIAIFAIAAPILVNKINEGVTTKTETTLPQLPQLLQSQQQEQKISQEILDSLKSISTNLSK